MRPGQHCAGGGVWRSKNVRRILVRGVNAPLPPEAKKIRKFDYEMVHSEVLKMLFLHVFAF